MTDAELIQLSRKKLRLTQGEFATSTGYSFQSVQAWETGRRNPKPETFRAILELIIDYDAKHDKDGRLINDRLVIPVKKSIEV